MRFEIVVAPALADAPADAAPGPLHVARPERRGPARELLDVFLDGANVTARVRETHGAFVLRDLANALGDLARRPRGKVTVRFYDEPWEICVERFGPHACFSVYRAGADPLVAVHDRQVPFEEIVSACRSAVDRVLARDDRRADSPSARLELASAAELLRSLPVASESPELGIPQAIPVVVEPERDSPLSFGAEFAMREGPPSGGERETVERADLHALLFRGHVRAEIRGRSVDLGECHPLLVAERLVELARRAFDAWERGLALNARGEAAGVVVGVRVAPDGEVALTLAGAGSSLATRTEGRAFGRRGAHHTFPALGVADLLEGSLGFGRALVRAILRRDRSQAGNLRLAAFRRALREGTEALRALSRDDARVNPSPEPYRAFAAALDDARRPETTSLPTTRLRYAPRWRAIVPGVDLRATYLCGDRMIVGTATEMWALDAATGKVLWRVDVTRGASVVTPRGIARLAPDGRLSVHDFGDGEVTVRAKLAPRVGGPVAGAVVSLPGLPKLVVVTEGEHHLVAIDLASGEARWRWSWSSARTGAPRGAPRLKRAGRLLYFACGDGALVALDVMTGAVVWRARDRLRFRAAPAVAHDALFAVAGGAHGLARLHCIDAFSGGVRWSADITDPTSPCTVEGAPLVADGAVAVAVRAKTGLTLAAFRPSDGAPIAARGRVYAPAGTSWLPVDDAFIGNAPTGELVSIGAASGELRWRHVLGPRPLEADVPRRLEPVLRSGALFVPHTDIAMVRPRDGALLGTIAPAEAIPDLLRVDGSGTVFIAEESGHLVCFGALPRLTLVPRLPG